MSSSGLRYQLGECGTPHLLTAAACILSIAFIIPIWMEFLAIDSWRHDSMFYLDSYASKLAEEGRWINYLLFNPLRRLNPYLSASLHLACLSFFVFVAARDLSRDTLYSLCVAMFALATAPLYIQLLWPVTSLPAFIVLALAALTHRQLKPWKFFALYGPLFFGTMGHLYFLLPLLFWKLLPGAENSAILQLRQLGTRLLIPWVTGYVAGFLAAQLMTALIGDGTGFALAEWRRPNPASDISQFVANLQMAFHYLGRDLSLYAQQATWAQLLVISALFIHRLINSTNRLYLLLPLLVIFSLYVSVVPFSVALSFRTSLTLWAGLTFLLLVPPNITIGQKAVYSLLLASLTLTSSLFTQRDLEWYRSSTDLYQQELAAIMDRPADSYRGIILVATRADLQRVEAGINRQLGLTPSEGIKTVGAPGRWVPVARTLGFTTIALCSERHQFPICADIDEESLLAGPSSPLSLYQYVVDREWLVVSINRDVFNNPGGS